MKIGLLGGSFDPLHNGHLHMAECAHKLGRLDEIWLMPAGHSPNKDENTMTPAVHRFCMCKLAADRFPWLVASRFEIDSVETSYTYRTLEKLAIRYPQHHFFFIMGADSLNYFEQWMHPEKIAKLSRILVIPRNNSSTAALADKIKDLQKLFYCDIRILNCSQYPISSTEIRTRLLSMEYDGDDLLPDVFSYIRQHHLYET